MLPSWMQQSLPSGSSAILPSKADLLRRALISANVKDRDMRDRSQKIYNSITDAASKFASSANSVIGSALDVLPGEPIQMFRENAAYLDRNVSEARKDELALQARERSQLDDSDYWGRAKLYAEQQKRNPLQFLAEVAGNIAPFVATAPVSSITGIGARALAVAEGAVFGGGAVRGGIYDQVLGTSDKDLMSDPSYAQLRSKLPENEAKKQLANKLASYGENGGKIALGAILGGLTGKLGADPQMIRALSGELRDKAANAAVRELAKESMLKAAAKSLGKEVSTEAIQEGTEQYLSNTGAASGGANIDPSEGVVESAVGAGLMAAIPGALAGPGEVMAAKAAVDRNISGDAERLRLDINNEINRQDKEEKKRTDPLESVLVERPSPEKDIPDSAYSRHPEVADGPEAIVFNGYLGSGLSPYNALVAAGYSPDQTTVKLANKVGKKVIPIARETRSIRTQVRPAIDEAVAEVNKPLEDVNAPTAEPSPVAIEPSNASVVLGDPLINKDSTETPTNDLPITEEPAPNLDEEANAKLAEIEAANPEVTPYAPTTRNRSEIWRPEINPITKPQENAAPSQLSLQLDSTPQLELVEDQATDQAPLENIPNQSQIYKTPDQKLAEMQEWLKNKPVESAQAPAQKQSLESKLNDIDIHIDRRLNRIDDLQSEIASGNLSPEQSREVNTWISDLNSQVDDLNKNREAIQKEIQPNKESKLKYLYNGEDIEITPEQKANLDLIDEMEEEENPKRAARLRRFVLDRLTDADKEMIAQREAKNYHGKRVSVDGKLGEIYANPGGKVSVKFDDGTKATVAREKVMFAGNPMEHLYSKVPTHSDHAHLKPSMLKMVWDFYNGINEKRREAEYEQKERDPAASIGNTGLIAYDPDGDTAPNVAKALGKQVELARTLRNTMMRIGQATGITTAKFNGLSASGRFWGINRTTSPGGKVYINPILIAQYADFKTKVTAHELVDAIIHELAHEVKDTGDHTIIHQREMERIINEIGPSLMADLENYVAKSLDMNALRAMAQEQKPMWDNAFSIGYDIVNGRFGESDVKKVSLGSINERQAGIGQGKVGVSNPKAGSGSNISERTEGARSDRSTKLSGNGREEGVSGSSGKKTERMAPRTDSGAGNGNTGISTASPADSLEESLFKLPLWTKLNNLAEKWINKYNRIDQVSKHLGDLARAITPRAAEQINETYARFVQPMEKLLGENNRTIDELDLYARAMQAPTRNATISKRFGKTDGSTMSTKQAREIIEKFKDDKVIKQAHAMLMAIAAEQRHVLVDSGLVSGEEMRKAADAMGPYYVPLHTLEVQNGWGGVVGGIDVRGKDLKYATGTNGPVKNVVAALIEQTNRTYVRAQKNAFMLDFADFAKNNPSDLWEIVNVNEEIQNAIDADDNGEIKRIVAENEHAIRFKHNGIDMKIILRDEHLERQVQGMTPSELQSFISSMRSFSALYSKLSTKWNPIFPITNFMRDTPMGLARVFSNEGGEAAIAVAKGLAPALKASATFRMRRQLPDAKLTKLESRAKQLLLYGGVPSWQGMNDAADIKSNIEKNVKANTKSAKGYAYKAAHTLGEAFTIGNEAIETGIRLSYFDYLMSIEEEKNKKAFMEANKNDPEKIAKYKDETFMVEPKKALEIASKVRGLTGDFQSQGTLSRYVGAAYPFFNASIQGIRSIGQMAIDAGKGNKRAQAVFATLATVGIIEDMLNHAVSGDDDDDGITNYDSIPDWLKRQKYIIPTGDGKSIVLPMTYGLSMAVNTGKMLSRMYRGNATAGDFAREMALATYESSNPLGSAATLTQMISPVQTDPIVQIAENKDWRGNRVFPDRYPGQQWKPNSEITGKKDTELSKSIARMINEYTGGSETEKGALANTPIGDITPYPGAIDATARWAVGGLGRFLGQLGSYAVSTAKGEQVDRLPFSSTFFTSPDAYFYKGRFYEQLDQIKQVRGMASGMKANARREELLKKYPEKKAIIEAMTAGDLKEAIPVIANNEELKKNFARIGVKRIALYKDYDAATKRIKKLEETDAPGKEEKILEIVKALNKKFVEASK